MANGYLDTDCDWNVEHDHPEECGYEPEEEVTPEQVHEERMRVWGHDDPAGDAAIAREEQRREELAEERGRAGDRRH